jgi:hypothetical protein
MTMMPPRRFNMERAVLFMAALAELRRPRLDVSSPAEYRAMRD